MCDELENGESDMQDIIGMLDANVQSADFTAVQRIFGAILAQCYTDIFDYYKRQHILKHTSDPAVIKRIKIPYNQWTFDSAVEYLSDWFGESRSDHFCKIAKDRADEWAKGKYK